MVYVLLQMDIKIKGITKEILKEALSASISKLVIEVLDVMEKQIADTKKRSKQVCS